MKSTSRFSFLIIALFLLSFCNNESTSTSVSTSNNGSAKIQVQVIGQNGGQAGLIATYADQNYRIDTASIDHEGRFTFTKSDGYPSGAYYVMLPNRKYFQILLDKGQKFSMTTQLTNLTGSMAISGNKDNELLFENLRFEQEMQPHFNEIAQRLPGLSASSSEYMDLKNRENELVNQRKNHLNKLYDSSPNGFFTMFKKAGQNPDLKEVYLSDGSVDFQKQLTYYRQEFWDNVDFSDIRLIRTPVVFNKLKRYFNELTVQQPDSIKISTKDLMDKVPEGSDYYKFFTNWVALNYEPTKTTLMDSEAIYVFMVQNYINHEKAFWADSVQVFGLQQRAHEMAASLIGLKGPNVTSTDPYGKSQSIYDISAPYIIVYLYNPTCDHCIEETPKLVNFYRQWKPKGVEVYAIAIDTDDQSWKGFINKNDMDWINVHDPSNKSIYAKYFVDNTPEVYVLNPERTIIGKNLKVGQIETIINKDKNNR